MRAEKPSLTLLSKLGSTIIHAQECLSKDGHPIDKMEFDRLSQDEEVKEWLQQMDRLALIPKKRG